jgi:DNA processing protein
MSIPKSLNSYKVNKLTLTDPEYPASLRDISSPPKTLFVKGNLELMNSPYRLAVIGSRKVSRYGSSVTESLVSRAVNAGVVIVSGLALGVDAVAHAACLRAGGKTIAVLPCGLNGIYPRPRLQLALYIFSRTTALSSLSMSPVQCPIKPTLWLATGLYRG